MKNFNAVRFLYPDAEFSMINDDVNMITWAGQEYPIPNDEQLQNAIKAVEENEAKIIADKKALKDSAKAKLIAGQPLTSEEADTLVI